MPNDTHTLQIGAATFDASTQRLKIDDREVRLHPKDMGVLLELVARAPEVVSREALLERVWAGTIVGENALDQVIARLRRALGDDAKHPRCIETLPKRGYRLMVSVVGRAAAATSGAYRENGASDVHTSEAPTVAIQPLVAIDTDSVLTQYAQIVSEDIARHLVTMKLVRVISYDVAHSGGALPAFIARGHVRRVADQVRVSIQLARTVAGEVLWAETFDELSQNVTADQFERAPYVARIVESIVTRVLRVDAVSTRSEEARRRLFYGIREIDLIALGAGGDWFVAIDHLERAVAHDPQLKEAHEMLAFGYGHRLAGKMRAAQALPLAHRAAAALLKLDPDATASLAYINHSLDFDYPSAMANIEHACAHGFDLPFSEYQKAFVHYKAGRFDEAIARMQAAISMGLASNEAPAFYQLADLFHATGRYDAALTAVDRALNSAGAVWLHGRILRIRIAYSMGNVEEARRELERAWQQYGVVDTASFPGVLAMLGRPEQAAAILRMNEASWRDGQLATAAYSFSGHYYLGEFDQAFIWLNRAIENREWGMLPYLRSERFYGNIRSDARFGYVMHRLAEIEAMGSPTRSVAAP